MTLVKCKECGHDVSSSARKCEHCGKSTPFNQGAMIFFILAAVFLILISMASCGGSSPLTGPNGSINYTGQWCAQLSPGSHAISAMTLTQTGSTITGKSQDSWGARNNLSTVTGTSDGTTVALTFSNFGGYGQTTLSGPAAGHLELTGTITAPNNTGPAYADWYRQPTGGGSPSGCENYYP